MSDRFSAVNSLSERRRDLLGTGSGRSTSLVTRSRHLWRTALSFVALPILCACGVTEPVEQRVVGFVDPLGRIRPPLVAPDTVRASEDLYMIVWTIGGGCTREGDTEVEHSAHAVRITPYDLMTYSGACLAMESHFAHAVQITLLDSGPLRVVVHARDIHGGEVVTLEREIWIQ
jgi:hypothetical protein